MSGRASGEENYWEENKLSGKGKKWWRRREDIWWKGKRKLVEIGKDLVEKEEELSRVR